MRRTFDPREAEARVRNSIINYFLEFRNEFDEYGLGDGDCSLLGGVWIQLVLPEIELLHVRGTERHVIVRRHWGGGTYDADLYADFHSSNARVRAAPAGELYPDLEPVRAEALTDAEFAHLRQVLERTGESGYPDCIPQLDELRVRAAAARDRLS